MILSIFSNPNIVHLAEIFGWMFGAFLIGLYFGRLTKRKEKSKHYLSSENFEDLNIKDDISKIRATKTFDRGGKEMIKTVPINIYDNGLNYNRIGTATFKTKDNLQKIKGIGTSIEDKMNEIGIFTFKQISNFNSNDISKVTELIKIFPGKFERNDWVGQAYNFLNEDKQ